MHARFAVLLWAAGAGLIRRELPPASQDHARHGFSPASHPNSALTQFPKA